MGINIFFERDFGMVVAIEFKWGVTGAGILGIVIDKFRHWQQPYSIILLLIDKCSKVCLHCTVLLFYLAICLRVEGYR